MEAVEIRPIGFVKTEAIGEGVRDKGAISKIILRRCLDRALEGVEGFSHLFVLFWMHEVCKGERDLKSPS